MLDVSRKDLIAGVAGSGTMGRGIIQVLAQCGVRVLVYDAKAGAAQTTAQKPCPPTSPISSPRKSGRSVK